MNSIGLCAFLSDIYFISRMFAHRPFPLKAKYKGVYMNFLTKHDLKPYKGTTMNPYDAVDRLSYVDSTVQIVQMLKAGVSAKLRASQMMCSDGDLNAPSVSVYAPDIADAYRQLHKLQDDLKENERLRSEEYRKAMEAKLAAQQSPEKGAISDLPSST